MQPDTTQDHPLQVTPRGFAQIAALSKKMSARWYRCAGVKAHR